MPVHYDIEAEEKKARKNIAAMNADLDGAIADGRAERGFATAQKELQEAQIQLFLGSMRSSNAGAATVAIAHATGLAIANMVSASLETFASDPIAAAAFVDGLNRAAVSGDAPAGAYDAVAEPMQSGRG